MYHNIQNNGEQGVIIYVSLDLDSIFVKSASSVPEFVFIKVELTKAITLQWGIYTEVQVVLRKMT